jgi:hypothetical protein
LLRITAITFGIRTLDLFSAIDKMVGEKEKKASIASRKSYYHHTVLSTFVPELFPICAPICIGMKQGKATRSPVYWGVAAKDIHIAD